MECGVRDRRAEHTLPASQAAGDERSAGEEGGNAARAGSRHARRGRSSLATRRHPCPARSPAGARWRCCSRPIAPCRPSARRERASPAGGIAAAFADAFANRELRLGEFAAWMRVQESLRKERSGFGARTDGPR